MKISINWRIKYCWIFLLLLSAGLPLHLTAQESKLIQGKVIDSITKEPLPYTTVFLQRQSLGTLTNEEGNFRLQMIKSVVPDSLRIASLGYKDFQLLLDTSQNNLLITLQPSISELQEVVVRPMPPTWYINRAMNNISEIRPKEAFQTEGYYVEKITENSRYLKYDEGIFRSYIPKFKDTLRRQYQLVLYRQPEQVYDMKFMEEERMKMEAKEQKKGKDKSKNGLTGIDFIFTSGGPAIMMHYASINRRSDDYLDSLEFKNYDYSFASVGNDAELMVIDFASKGVVNHARKSGKIFIHLPTNAILKIEGQGEFVIPVMLRPLMFLYGFSAQEMTFKGKKEYQVMNGKWYFKTSTVTARVGVTKKHWFSANEHADFTGAQTYTILRLWEQPVNQIEQAKRYNPDKIMRDQVFPEPGLQWSDLGPVK